MNLVERVKAILLQPNAEWPAIEREPGDPGYLYSNYVCILAAIPPLCAFIGGVLIGYGPFRLGIISGLVNAIITYVLALVGVYVVAYAIDFLAGTFGARRDFANALRVSAYAPTAAWVVGVFNLIPALGFLAILGLYGLYTLHTGLVALMKPPAEKALLYTIAVIAAVFVIYLIVFGIFGAVFGVGMIGAMGRI